MMSEFPEAWCTMALSDAVINIMITDKKIPQKEYLIEGMYPVFDQGQNYIGGYTDKKDKLVECELPVVVFGDHTRVIKFVNRPFAAGADGVKVLQPKHFYLPKLFEYFTHYLAVKLPDHGYARHYQHLAKSIIPLPPLKEQHRIVAKIEELFSELDKGIENFKTAREQLKVYRQALLKHAFSGKLTEQWRAENPDKLESTEILLERIQNERQQRYQQQLKEWEANGKQGSKPKAPKTMAPLTAEELAELPELPEKWEYVSLLNLIMEVADVDHKMPKAQRDGIPYISTKDFFDQEAINYSMAKRISADDYYNLCKKIKPEYADLLLSRYGTVGEVRKVDYQGDFQASYSIAILKTLKNQSEFIDYLKWAIRSEVIQKQIRKYIRATAQPDLGLVDIRRLAIPVPAREEQVRIIEILEVNLSELDQLDQTIATALQQADVLRQSILKKAFSGQLVPQNPDDEPASALLERIKLEKAERATQNNLNKNQKRKTLA